MTNTNDDWERWGAHDPYFGVYSDGRFRQARLDDDARAAFFASGEEHVAKVLAMAERHFPVGAGLASALDFGCGVGRLAIPLAARYAHVTGLDVSNSMLEEARKNCVARQVDNVRLSLTDDALSNVDTRFDLVHSHIVLQHVPWRRGRSILARLASCVAPGGRLIVQVVTAHRGGALPRALARVRYALPVVHRLWNIARQRPASDPPMQLNVYPLATVLADMTAQGLVLATEQELWPDVVSTYLVGSRPRPV